MNPRSASGVRALILLIAASFVLAGCGEPAAPSVTPDEARAIAQEAYVFSFPMLMGYRYGFATFLEPSLPTYRGPANAIYGEPVTLDYKFKDVITPNADTPYSMALLDLRAEPVVLEVPAVPDRYYVMQFVDLFGTNPHFVGSRATGPNAGTYLLVGPRWDGDAGEEFDGVLRFETDLVFVIGRTQLLGASDVEALGKIMRAYSLQPLSAFRGEEGPSAPLVEWPAWNDDASRDERFIGYVNFLLQFCQPTNPSEVDLMQRFGRIGIAPDASFDPDALDPAIRTALREGVADARAKMAAALESGGEEVNGWGIR